MLKFILVTLLFIGAACSGLAALNAFSSDSDIGKLTGAQVGCDCDCFMKGILHYRCLDLGPQGCSTDSCTIQLNYYAECPELLEGEDCSFARNAQQLETYSEWRSGEPDECDTANNDPVVFLAATDCRKSGVISNCIVNSCGGILLGNPISVLNGYLCDGLQPIGQPEF